MCSLHRLPVCYSLKNDFYHTTDSDPDVCYLCDNSVDVQIEPCGHAAMCNKCAQRAKRCPICRVFNYNNAVKFLQNVGGYKFRHESDTFSTVYVSRAQGCMNY